MRMLAPARHLSPIVSPRCVALPLLTRLTRPACGRAQKLPAFLALRRVEEADEVSRLEQLSIRQVGIPYVPMWFIVSASWMSSWLAFRDARGKGALLPASVL